MDRESKKILREGILDDIRDLKARLDRINVLIGDIRWGTSEKRAKEIRRALLEAEVDIGNLLYELRDCIRDDERRE